MCLGRKENAILDRFLEPVPANETRDEFTPRQPNMEIERRVRYNLLLPNDEDASETGNISNMEDSDEDDNSTSSNIIRDIVNEFNEMSNSSNDSDSFETAQSIRDREFDLNIPQILLSMARVSQNLDTIISAHLANSGFRD